MSIRLFTSALIALAFGTTACGSGGSRENPEDLDVATVISKARASETGWVRLRGKVGTTGFASSKTRHGWVCPEDAASGFSFQGACVTCMDSGAKEALARKDGKTVTLVGRLWVNGLGEVALQSCVVE